MRRYFTIKEKLFIESHPELSGTEIGKIIGKTNTQVNNFGRRNGLHAHPKGFKKGHATWNKGVRYNAGGRSIETRFKKGHKKPNERKMYSTFIGGDGRVYIKLPGSKQYPYGRYVYEQHHGVKLSDADIVRCKDGNPLNCDISNLLMLSRSENVKLNVNRKKSAEGLRIAWGVVRTCAEYGVASPYKFKVKKTA